MVNDSHGIFLESVTIPLVKGFLFLRSQTSGTDEPGLDILILGTLVNDFSRSSQSGFGNSFRIKIRKLSLDCPLFFRGEVMK